MLKNVNVNTIKRDTVNIKDFSFVGASAGNAFCLLQDDSSYLWSWGAPNALQGGNSIFKMPIAEPILFAGPCLKFKSDTTHTTVLDYSSYAWCWGTNTSGSLGTNSTTNYYSPVSVVGGRQFKEICNVYDGTVALDVSGFAYAWGINTSGSIGDNTVANKSSPVSVVGNRRFIKVSNSWAGSVIVLDMSSYAWTWGLNTSGQLGDNTILNKSSPVSVVGAKQWIDIKGYTSGFIGIDNSSLLWGWGTDDFGQLGDGLNINRSSPKQISATLKCLKLFSNSASKGIFALDESSRLWGWGLRGCLGNGIASTNAAISSPTLMTHLPSNTINVDSWNGTGTNACGLAITSDNDMYGWNLAATTDTLSASFPIFIGGITKRDTYTHSMGTKFALTNNYGLHLDSSSYLWGHGNDSNNGIFSKYPCLFYRDQFPSTAGNIFLQPRKKCNELFTIGFLDASSYAWTFGLNTSGQLGDWTIAARLSPVSVIGGKQWKNIVSTATTCIGLDMSSYAWAWGGSNSLGNLGTNDILNRSSPTSVVGNKKFISVVINNNGSAAALDESSYAWSWGANTSGFLGDGTIINKSSPISVIGGRKFIKIASCALSFAALDESSFLWTWGLGNNGNLGDNTVANRSSPVSVVGNRQFTNIFSSPLSDFYIALDVSGYVWSWGNNASGQLGNNSILSRSSPVSVNTSLTWSSITTGISCVLGIANGSSYLWGWGVSDTNRISLLPVNRSVPNIVNFPLKRYELVKPTDIFGKNI